MERIKLQHKCRGCGIFVPEGELYSPDDPDDPQALLLCRRCYMGNFAAEEEEEDELKKYSVTVPALHYYAIGPVEAYDEDEAVDEVRNNWRSHWRHTIEDNGDWGGPLWRYSRLSSHEPEAHEVFESDESFRAESTKSAAPVEVVNNREGFFDEKQDREYFGFGFIVGGIIVGVLGTIFGNIFSELVLDEMRVNKFGYRGTGEKSSFWELDGE
jgi:hypothetical protein